MVSINDTCQEVAFLTCYMVIFLHMAADVTWWTYRKHNCCLVAATHQFWYLLLHRALSRRAYSSTLNMFYPHHLCVTRGVWCVLIMCQRSLASKWRLYMCERGTHRHRNKTLAVRHVGVWLCQSSARRDTEIMVSVIVQNCQSNSVGSHCENCEPGYYSVSAPGLPEHCLPCRCPLPSADNPSVAFWIFYISKLCSVTLNLDLFMLNTVWVKKK